MSYNTRRGGSRPSPTTQVNYHQQPNRPAAGNVGYSTTSQPPQTYNQTQSSYSTPAYTTTPPQPAQQKAAPQQKGAPSTPAAKPPVTTTATPALKQEPITPAGTPQAPADPSKTTEVTENGEANGEKKVPFWRKRPLVKVSNKVKRARQNAKLRRVLNPKNALTFLNELRPGTGKFMVKEDPNWGFVATVEVDGKTFTGYGLGTSKAKVQASEKALKYLLMEQLSKAQQAAAENKEDDKEDKDGDVKMETDEGEGAESKDKPQKVKPEDEVPWGSLAAFALHKLFTEWQKEGPPDAELQAPYPSNEKFDADEGEDLYYRRPNPPEFGYRTRGYAPYPGRGRGFPPYPARGHPPGFGPGPVRRPPPPGMPAAPSAPFGNPFRPQGSGPATNAPMRKIPEDANQRHPVMLLNQLKPNLVYQEAREGEQPRVTFVITVNVDGVDYVGRGRNKKEAKKQAAKAALAPIGIIYPNDD